LLTHYEQALLKLVVEAEAEVVQKAFLGGLEEEEQVVVLVLQERQTLAEVVVVLGILLVETVALALSLFAMKSHRVYRRTIWEVM